VDEPLRRVKEAIWLCVEDEKARKPESEFVGIQVVGV
jgi:hypothetical protein